MSIATSDPAAFRAPHALDPWGLPLVFFADGYVSWEEFDHDVAVLIERMRSAEPWSSYNTYNIYRINPMDFSGCTVQVLHERKPTLRCDPEAVNRYLVSLPLRRFKLIVLSRQTFQSWANVSRLENSGIFFSLPQSPTTPADQDTAGWLFLHLLGHAFGLKDEEVFVIAKANSQVHLPNGPNCAPDQAAAEQWWGDLVGQDASVGYFAGCAGNPRFLKPTRSSLMNLNDLSQFTPTYGPVSERYLRQILTYCFAEPRLSQAEDRDFFERYPEFHVCLAASEPTHELDLRSAP